MDYLQKRSHWSGRWVFIMATAGSAVGLGNIWKFPYMTGVHGGSAFVLVYLLCVALIGLPLMMTEIMLGRRAQLNPVDGMGKLAREAGGSPLWRAVGVMGVIAGILILSFYSVIGGWVLDYGLRAATSAFTDINGVLAQAQFDVFLATPQEQLAWHTIFMVLTLLVVARGVNSGLEQANRIMMPGLLIILLVLLGYSLAIGNFQGAVNFLFHFDAAQLTPEVILSAMGHAFFTLSLGMGTVMVYGSYLQRHVSIGRAALYIVIADTSIALLTGLAIFALVFANHLEPAAGPGLMFQTLPIAFGNMPYGGLFGTLFFIFVAFAAWTSAISLVEPAVAWLSENTRLTRAKSTLMIGSVTWLLGIAVILSFNEWSDFTIFGNGIFDALDKLTTNIMLPLGGLLMAVFAIWVMHGAHAREELDLGASLYRAWYWAVKYVAPLAILAVFLNLTGLVQWA